MLGCLIDLISLAFSVSKPFNPVLDELNLFSMRLTTSSYHLCEFPAEHVLDGEIGKLWTVTISFPFPSSLLFFALILLNSTIPTLVATSLPPPFTRAK
jgi:hypothetical protein